MKQLDELDRENENGCKESKKIKDVGFHMIPVCNMSKKGGCKGMKLSCHFALAQKGCGTESTGFRYRSQFECWILNMETQIGAARCCTI